MYNHEEIHFDSDDRAIRKVSAIDYPLPGQEFIKFFGGVEFQDE